MTYKYKNAFYVCINKGHNYVPKEIESNSILIDEDISKIINELNN